MGFVLDNVHKLVIEEFFDEASGEFLEIRCKPLTLGEWFALINEQLEPEAKVELFTSHLVDWNLQQRGEDGDPVAVPATREGVDGLDVAFVLRLLNLWVRQLGSVHGPLGGRSTSGPQSVEASIPMEAVSGSP